MQEQLSPREKRRLDRLTRNITTLARRGNLSQTSKFILREQAKKLLEILGADKPNDQVLIYNAIRVLSDVWPFKERRLNKLIHG